MENIFPPLLFVVVFAAFAGLFRFVTVCIIESGGDPRAKDVLIVIWLIVALMVTVFAPIVAFVESGISAAVFLVAIVPLLVTSAVLGLQVNTVPVNCIRIMMADGTVKQMDEKIPYNPWRVTSILIRMNPWEYVFEYRASFGHVQMVVSPTWDLTSRDFLSFCAKWGDGKSAYAKGSHYFEDALNKEILRPILLKMVAETKVTEGDSELPFLDISMPQIFDKLVAEHSVIESLALCSVNVQFNAFKI